MPAVRKSKSQPSWSDIKAKLAHFDRVALVGLVADLYALSKSNQSFLHARFSLRTDSLATYKRRIHDALSPDGNKPVRIADVKKAVSEYRKAIGRPEGLLELRLFWCEAALNALRGMNETSRKSAIERLVAVRDRTDVGYGVKDDMGYLLDRAGVAP
jgi:hypothetical protein